MGLYRVGELPDAALAAAARFHGDELPQILARLDPPRAREGLVVVFPPADHTHHGWRLAAVQQLAREYAPARVNALVSDDDAAIAATLEYLAHAEGVTGQLLALDGIGAGTTI